jgi:hypothetical protein
MAMRPPGRRKRRQRSINKTVTLDFSGALPVYCRVAFVGQIVTAQHFSLRDLASKGRIGHHHVKLVVLDQVADTVRMVLPLTWVERVDASHVGLAITHDEHHDFGDFCQFVIEVNRVQKMLSVFPFLRFGLGAPSALEGRAFGNVFERVDHESTRATGRVEALFVLLRVEHLNTHAHHMTWREILALVTFLLWINQVLEGGIQHVEVRTEELVRF